MTITDYTPAAEKTFQLCLDSFFRKRGNFKNMIDAGRTDFSSTEDKGILQ